MITYKPNVRVKVLSPALLHIQTKLFNLNLLKIPNYPEDWVITSINDGMHMNNSRHYNNEALDLRSKNFQSLEMKLEFQERLKFELGSTKFTVLLENIGKEEEHFHIQVKKGTKFT